MITAVVCSDDRMLFVYKKLHMYGNVLMIDGDTDLLALPHLDALILPVKGIDADGYINFKQTKVHVPSMFWTIQKDVLLFCGIPCEYVQRLSQEKDYYLLDHHVIEENAILTAEGVLHLLITSVSKSLYDIQVDVIGYGNCGKAIYRMLKNLDVNVHVIRRECKEDAVFHQLSNWDQCGDVIVHTSIQKVIDEARMKRWKKKPLIIDIATPDVVDIIAAKQLDIRYIKAGNLPGRFCAESAGRIIADYVRGKLKI